MSIRKTAAVAFAFATVAGSYTLALAGLDAWETYAKAQPADAATCRKVYPDYFSERPDNGYARARLSCTVAGVEVRNTPIAD